MEHCERVNYRTMEEFELLGVQFAFPSVYVVNKDENPATNPCTRSSTAKEAA